MSCNEQAKAIDQYSLICLNSVNSPWSPEVEVIQDEWDCNRDLEETICSWQGSEAERIVKTINN